MQNFKAEKDFMIGDYRCVILGLSLGHRCDYVGLPKEHKYYNMHYELIDVDVHGGLTYSDRGNGYPVKDDRWWIGFDCAHYTDAKDLDLLKELNDENTYNIFSDMERRYDTGGVIRTTEYVENQLIELVKQLEDKGEVIKIDMNDLKNKKLPFNATVKGDYLDCYDWEDEDRLQIMELADDLDAKNNEYLWRVMNIDKNEYGGASTYQMSFT